jgi:hypothetical protein
MKNLLFVLSILVFITACNQEAVNSEELQINIEVKNALQGTWNGDAYHYTLLDKDTSAKLGGTFPLSFVGDSVQFPIGTCLNQKFSEGPNVKCFYEIKNGGKLLVIHNTTLQSQNGTYKSSYNFDILKQYQFTFLNGSSQISRPAFLIENKENLASNKTQVIEWIFFKSK